MNRAGQVNWSHVLTVTSATILVLTEVLAVAVAAGWALGGLLNLGDLGEYVLMGLFALLALYATRLYYRRAVQAEPLRYPR
ncbi:hypothetical protein ACT6QG_13665 [Xanthobacter sp. TB0136]|uniref:hypothetical protein n=1 Tax=Xanthobacter sp. TB0136 TaxID=3459177 RepID=UPI0040394ED2